MTTENASLPIAGSGGWTLDATVSLFVWEIFLYRNIRAIFVLGGGT
jgi:hypothetical protein